MSRSLDTALTTEMAAWRLEHPKATLREIERELDTRLNHRRARMLEDLALTSSAASWTQPASTELPLCSECDQPLQPDGTKQRTLLTHGGQALTLLRSYGVCPACGAGLFPPGLTNWACSRAACPRAYTKPWFAAPPACLPLPKPVPSWPS